MKISELKTLLLEARPLTPSGEAVLRYDAHQLRDGTWMVRQQLRTPAGPRWKPYMTLEDAMVFYQAALDKGKLIGGSDEKRAD